MSRQPPSGAGVFYQLPVMTFFAPWALRLDISKQNLSASMSHGQNASAPVRYFDGELHALSLFRFEMDRAVQFFYRFLYNI